MHRFLSQSRQIDFYLDRQISIYVDKSPGVLSEGERDRGSEEMWSNENGERGTQEIVHRDGAA